MEPRAPVHPALMGQGRPSAAPPGDFCARPPPCPPSRVDPYGSARPRERTTSPMTSNPMYVAPPSASP
eukprot:13296766-Heterocapsa_arctica.AAC.1